MVEESCASVNSECTRVGPAHCVVCGTHVYTREHACAGELCLLRYPGEHVFVSACVCGGVPVCVCERPVYMAHTRVHKGGEAGRVNMYVYSTCIDSL